MFPFHNVQGEDGRRTLTVFLVGETPVVIHGDHPHYDAILAAASDEGSTATEIRELADLSAAVASRFTALSERVKVAAGRVYFDHDEVDSAITRQIVRALDANLPNWQPLVAFMENVAANPNDHSREQLYDWLNARDFTVTEDGQIVAYKGVGLTAEGAFLSGFSGTAVVNGVTQNGRIRQERGDTVEMPRARVAHDPSSACSTGLHVGTFEYAKGYAQGALLKVTVNPRDVVSVPTDASGEKVRVCRYQIIDTIDAPETAVVEGYADVTGDEYEDESYESYYATY